MGFGPEGILEVDADATYGALGGISIPLGSRLYAGASLKYIRRETVTHNFSAREIVDSAKDLNDLLYDDLGKKGSTVGFDAGAIWTIAPDSWWRPALGLSVMNIGALDFQDAGTIPMTINAGFSIHPKIDAFRSLLLAVDYVDIANNYTQDTDMAQAAALRRRAPALRKDGIRAGAPRRHVRRVTDHGRGLPDLGHRPFRQGNRWIRGCITPRKTE